MNLNIKMLDEKPKKKWGLLTVKGEIRINNFQENLYFTLDWWGVDEYRKQWKQAIERLKNYDRTCFVVSIHNPAVRKYIDWWVLYKVGNKIYIRNSLILGDIYQEIIGDKPFTLETCYDFIPERGEPYDEDGNKISEWVVDWK